jgi:hypothetical protein
MATCWKHQRRREEGNQLMMDSSKASDQSRAPLCSARRPASRGAPV